MSEENNVTPIEPVQVCASCGSRHTHRERFRLDAHNDRCMQPEIRMKRLEARVADLTLQFEHEIKLIWATFGPPEKPTHGISEASPDTQRSGSPVPDPERERRVRCHGDAGVCSYCPITQDSGEPHADTSSAEPERAPPAGAEPAGDPGGDT